MPATAQRAGKLEAALRTVIRGKDDVIRLALVGVLARGHLLIEDVPGVGKNGEKVKGRATIEWTLDKKGLDANWQFGPVSGKGFVVWDPATKRIVNHEFNEESVAALPWPLSAMVRLRAFEALRHRDYRLLWYGQIFSSMGTWMDQVTRGWLIYELTNSALQLGLVRGIQAIPFLLLSPIAGSAADR